MPAARAEQARALLLDLVPGGFEEVDRGDELELAAYVTPVAERSLRSAFMDVEAEDVPEGWADAWRRFHRPVRVGSLWIVPPWERPAGGTQVVVIDPGQAFGTGAHPTTRLCLELLLSIEPTSIVDLGCGSGVLGIAASKLGFAPVFALDRDVAAVEATRANARANDALVDARLADVLVDPIPDVEVGLANLERALVEPLAARPSPACLVVSGFLTSDRLAFPGWRLQSRRELDGWAAELLRRR